MFSTDAINRINNIKWNEVGEKGNSEDGYLMAEFLRRLAKFSVLNSITPRKPFFINIATELGDKEYKEDLKWANKDAYEYITSRWSGLLIKSYIQLSFMADKDETVSKYLEIYDPFIRLVEKGIEVIFWGSFADVVNVGSFPLTHWMERGKDDPFEISHL